MKTDQTAKEVKEPAIEIDGNNHTINPKGSIVVRDCDGRELGVVTGKDLDAIIATAEMVEKAPDEACGYSITYTSGGNVSFGDGARVYSVKDLKRIQKLSQSRRK